MRKKLFLSSAIMMACMNSEAQNIAPDYKGSSYGNPISACVFCADPTAIEYDGRLYVYGTNDHQQYIVNKKQGSNGYGNIKSLVVFSTDDMVNWTFHGTIDVGKVCGSWCGQSWAPSAVWREKENTNGTTTKEFFIYFANGGGSVGVIKSTTSPVGPFTSPLSQAMIRHGMPGVDPCNWVFDPGAVIDDNGVGWIAFGGGEPQDSGSKLWPGNSRIAKLKPSMIALDGAAVNMPAPYLFEASELNMMNGRYVYTYNTSWSDRNDWNSFTKRNGQLAPSSCSMCYMVSDNPLDPESWEYRGEYVPNEGNFGMGWGNNHTHLHKYNGTYYLFYHSILLESSMKNAGAMDSNASGYRSIGVNRATVNEEKQTINKMTLTKSGVAAIKKLNPFELQQAETMASAGGISYENFKNIKTVPSKNTLGNDASENLYIKMPAGSWTSVRKVDFGTGAKSFMLRAKGTGKMEIRLGTITSAAAATVELSSTTFSDYKVELDQTMFIGTKNVFFVFTESTNNNVQFDAWQFYEDDISGIHEVQDAQSAPINNGVYNLSGHRLQKTNARRGIVIENGKKVMR